jgi:hypothetical protein
MSVLWELINTYLFTGVTGNTAYDALKIGLDTVLQKDWEELYLDAFQRAIEQEKQLLTKYSDNGQVELSTEDLKRVIREEIAFPIKEIRISALSSDSFIKQLATAMSKQEVLLIGGNRLNQQDYESLIRCIIRVAHTRFRDAITQNESMFKSTILRELESNHLAVESIENFLSEQLALNTRLLTQVSEHVKSQEDLLNQYLAKLESSTKQSNQLSSNTRPKINSLCSGYQIESRPTQYYLSQEFNDQEADLRQAIEMSFLESGFSSIQNNDFFEGVPRICKICALIQSTYFGVYHLNSSHNRNVYLELGMAIGMGKPFVLVKQSNIDLTNLLQGLEYYTLDSYMKLSRELRKIYWNYITSIEKYQLISWPKSNNQATALIAHGHLPSSADFACIIAEAIKPFGYKSVIFGKFDTFLTEILEEKKIEHDFVNSLDETVQAIQNTRLCVFRVDELSDPGTFTVLGIAIGLNCPVLLVNDRAKSIPFNLQGLNRLEFVNLTELKDSFIKKYKDLLTALPAP